MAEDIFSSERRQPFNKDLVGRQQVRRLQSQQDLSRYGQEEVPTAPARSDIGQERKGEAEGFIARGGQLLPLPEEIIW